MLLLLRPRNRYFASATLHPCLLLLPSMAIRSASIHTLSAANLTCEDFVSLDKYAKRAYVSCLNDKKKFAWITYGTEDFRVKPFPKGTQGFLYYAPGPKHAPIAGALRFRVTESRDPGAFHSGHNLIHHNGGTPWGITLLSLGTSRAIYRPLYDLLVSPKQPRLISDTLKDVLKTKTKITGTVVHSLGQPFMLDLSRSATICIASGHSVGPGINTPILGVQRHAGDGKLHYPYTGLLSCTFERSHEPDVTHIRVLKIVKPVQSLESLYHGERPTPVEGQLLMLSTTRPWKTWNRDICNLPEVWE